jgi:long-chain acyl-CoA synthetase
MQICRFILLYKQLDPDDEELTRTRKLRRRFVHEKYEKEINSVYSESDTVPVKAQVRYQDGRTSTISTNLYICTMKSDEEYEAMFKRKRWWSFWRKG